MNQTEHVQYLRYPKRHTWSTLKALIWRLGASVDPILPST